VALHGTANGIRHARCWLTAPGDLHGLARRVDPGRA
jgi:hypothetical protein